AVDAVVDVVGGVAGLDLLGVEAVYCSALHVGGGTVASAHGILPVPAPATAELLRGVPVYDQGIRSELLTPTGAAILTTLASGFGPMPAMRTASVGYGAGTADLEIPNLLRVQIGDTEDDAAGYRTEQVAVMETVVDDMDPQIWGHVVQRLFDMGALDVFLSPVQMKKHRPGTLATVVCRPEHVRIFADVLMRETTSIGVRWRTEDRITARRVVVSCDTPLGTVRCKFAFREDEIINVKPEYDDCRRIACETNLPLKTVMETAKRFAFIRKRETGSDAEGAI
ncbi:MAG: nickel pincer cofactor biosynthesis protein LarC, partial [Desulfococcus multivorans]|nr:nickel pincer cofactor biosynthesis protein LarC [Desulfococcus multivorans]